MQLSRFACHSIASPKVLFSVLFASLPYVSVLHHPMLKRKRTLAGLPSFAPITFHLLASYSFIAASNAALFFLVSMV